MPQQVAAATPPRGSLLTACWRCRRNVLRVTVALALVGFLSVDLPRAVAWLQYLQLPGVDYLAEAQRLRNDERYEEALLYVKAGLRDQHYASEHGEALRALQAELEAEQKSWLRRAVKALQGAISGYGRSTEALVGAILADLFVVGDMRDLAIQTLRGIQGEDVDEVIVALSAIGIGTTVAPIVDLGAAVTKIAAKTGHIGRHLMSRLAELARLERAAQVKPLAEFAGEVGRLGKRTGAATVLRVLRHADDPADVARLARYAEKYGDEAAFAVHALEGEAIRTLKRGDEVAETAVRLAAKKGPAGRAWLRSGRWRQALRPHPVLGLFKGIWKGNIPKVADQVLRRLVYPYFWLVLPAALGWLGIELLLLVRRVGRERQPQRA